MLVLFRSQMSQLLTHFGQSFVILLTVIISLMTQRSKAVITDTNYSSVFKGTSIIVKPDRTAEGSTLSNIRDDNVVQNHFSNDFIHFKVKDTVTNNIDHKSNAYRLSNTPEILINSHAKLSGIFTSYLFKKRHLLEVAETVENPTVSSVPNKDEQLGATTNIAETTTEPNHIIHVCNVNVGYPCLCSNCEDNFLSSPTTWSSTSPNNLDLQCCNALFSNTTLQQSVDIILKDFTLEDFLKDTFFEDKIRNSTATSVQQYCNPNPDLCPMMGWNTSDTSNASYTITHVLITSLQQSNNDLIVNVLVLLSENSVTLKNQTLMMMNNSHPLASEILQAAIRNQSDYISQILGTDIWIQGMKNETQAPFVRVKKSYLKSIVLGAIGGFIMVAICLLSAVKAVRDRRDIKARIEAKKEKARKKSEINLCGQVPLEPGEAETSIMEDSTTKQNHLKNGKTPNHVIEALVHVYNNCNGSDSKMTSNEEIKMVAHNNNKGGQNGRSLSKAETQLNGKEHSGTTVTNGNGVVHSDNENHHIVANGNHDPGIDNNAFEEV